MTESDDRPPFGRFFLPGPTDVRPEVLRAMTRPMMPHRGKEFEALFARLQEGLRLVFRTRRPVLVSSSSATGLMEAAVRCAPPGAVLALVNGAFSARFAAIARACGRDTETLEAPLGRAVALEAVEERLRARRFAAVTVVHSETSTGALTDVRAATDLARAHGAACLVDSVTGVGGIPVETDAWGLDFVLTGSQKALALPPGLAFAVASEEYMRTAALAPSRGLYFDLVEFEAFARKHQTPNTPALPLLYALDEQLGAIMREGMEARWARHAAMAAEAASWVEELGDEFGLLPPRGERAETVSTVTLPERLRGGEVAAAVARRGWTIGGGYGPLRDATIRIGHMGDHTVAGLRDCLAVCADVLREG
jgi:aspartate aminotransferase-like enzyme